jgi:hypothetical protein
MKLKRIISTALMVVMIFTTLVAVLPVGASAAYSPSGAGVNAAIPEGTESASLNSAELTKYLNEYLKYKFETAEEMLAYECERGYLYCSKFGDHYTLYINKYTGFVYYVNNYTGQILTSNPVDPGNASDIGTASEIMSQLSLSFIEVTNSTSRPTTMISHTEAAARAQITVTAISGGLRVNYTLGDTTARFLLPGRVIAADFEECILIPMLEKYEQLLVEYCSEKYPDENFSFFENEDYIPYQNDCINSASGKKSKGIKYYFEETKNIYKKAFKSSSDEYKQLDDLQSAVIQILTNYALNNPAEYIGNDRYKAKLEEMYDKYPITKEGKAIYVYSGYNLNETKKPLSDIIKKYCPDYTFAMMYNQEEVCGYVDESLQKPVFRCALEYTFNKDGSLSVRLPASAITFDETVYTLKDITPLQYFGAGDMSKAGYIFYPDGSGTIIEFSDFYDDVNNKKINLSYTSTIYGKDYCYSKITGAHKEQITMPVYGIVNEIKSNSITKALFGKETVTNGFFAIIEEGSSLANLSFDSAGVSHRYADVFASYTPYPSDEFDLSETISVGSASTYTMVSESKYTGSYVTRFVMLADEDVGAARYGKDAFYESSYVGMAAYYRNYLKENGVLEALEIVNDNLPLYIEVLGAMDITAKFLSFPITKTIPLTTFGNVSTMYEELSKCEEYVVKKIAEFKALLEKEEDDAQKYHYEQQIKTYEALVGNVQNIKNINFKLTGFANGGMASTYPVKVKWERACGGKSGFKKLIKNAATISTAADQNFAVYPEFDFMYINNTSMFDGISNKGNVSRMVDNRYASKQVYNSVLQDFESFFTLVINPDALDNLYSKFLKKYSKYKISNLSVSTLGSDLNSNFDEDDPINRDQAMSMVQSVMDKMVNVNGYDLMVDVGNIYAVEYATHILNATIDSSHLRYSSYTIPFTGLVLHSYVNYTGTPLNYSGSPDYDILRAIESGASLYYIVCYQNTSHMKDDKNLSQYYGVDYHNWYDDILSTYDELNSAIGDLQSYEIVDHDVLIAEREIEEKETQANYVLLKKEILEILDAQLLAAVDAKLQELKESGASYDVRVKLDVTDENRATLMAQFAEILNLTVADIEGSDFAASVDAVISKYEAKYPGAATAENTVVLNFSSIDYTSKYSYITDSFAQDKNYVYTDYTIDNGNITMVTYKNGDSVVRFILNYNNYTVTVRLDAEHVYELNRHSYVRID